MFIMVLYVNESFFDYASLSRLDTYVNYLQL